MVGAVETPSKRYTLQGSFFGQERNGYLGNVDTNPNSVSCQMHGIDTDEKDENFCLCQMEVSDKVRSIFWMSICPFYCVANRLVPAALMMPTLPRENWLWGELQHCLCWMKRVALQALLAATFYYLREGLGDILTRGRQSDEHWSLGSWQTLLVQYRRATGRTWFQCHGNAAMQCCLF